MKRLVYFLFFILSACAPRPVEIILNHQVVIDLGDNVAYVNVMSTDRNVRTDLDNMYFWFKSGEIKNSRGGYEGTLLHGEYIEFYPDKSLKEKGNFRFGLKHGVWKTWYPNGELASVVRWRNGKRSGKFLRFEDNGDLSVEGCYQDDELHGQVKTYLENDVCKEEKFRKGKKILKSGRRFPLFRRKKPKETKPPVDSVRTK